MSDTFRLFGVGIAEPVTAATDYLITLVAAWLAWRLLAAFSRTGRTACLLWGVAFTFIGLGAFLGGTSHGFAPYLDGRADAAIWKGTVYTIGLAMVFAMAGSIVGTTAGAAVRRMLLAANVLAFAGYAWWMTSHDSFRYVVAYYAPVMTIIAAMQALEYVRHRTAAALWIVAGVVITLLGAAIQQSGFSLHRYFNHNDLFHVVQIAGLCLLYRGAILADPEPTGMVATAPAVAPDPAPRTAG